MVELIDPRWKMLKEHGFQCARCDELHDGLMDLASFAPDHWPGEESYSANALVASSTNFLSEDFCIIEGRDYFVRCVLELPLIGSGGDRFGFGVWSTLSKKNFDTYVETFDAGATEGAGPWFGWLSNNLKTYPSTLNLKCQVHPQPRRQRPLIELESTDHPLSQEFRNGITYERLLEVFAANGHVLHPAPN